MSSIDERRPGSRARGTRCEAIGHRLAAGEHGAAVRLMYVLGPQLISDGQIDTLRGLLERIGEPATNDPACALTWGWCDYIGGHYARAREWVDITHRLASPDFDPIITAPLRMNLAVADGDVGTALELGSRDEGHRPVRDPRPRTRNVGRRGLHVGRPGCRGTRGARDRRSAVGGRRLPSNPCAEPHLSGHQRLRRQRRHLRRPHERSTPPRSWR